MEQTIKTYKRGLTGTAEKKFERDAKKLAENGWRVQSQSSTPVGPFISRITVVYVRS